MRELTTIKARKAARIKAAKADIKNVADYIEANGWMVLVIGPGSIEQDYGARKFQYRFVVYFTGVKKRSSPERKK